jgi:Ca-activated chloride channel family protein
MSRKFSIRRQLEIDAWRNYPRFAQQQAALPQRRPEADKRALNGWDRALLICSALLLLFLSVWTESSRAQDAGQEFWGMEFQDGAGSQRTVAVDTDIQVEVTGLTARIEVSQVFQNTGRAWKEAVYRYPLPPGSAVDRMRIQVGSRVLEGEIQEKAEARRQYRQARNTGRIASLVEQQRPNQFETSLANIAPGENIRVAISFLTRIKYSDGSFSLRIPMTFTPRWSAVGAGVAGDISDDVNSYQVSAPLIEPLEFADKTRSSLDDHYLTIDVDLRAGMNLVSLESRYHDVDIHPSLHGYRVFLADPDTRTDRVFELNWTPEFATVPESTLSTFDDGDAVYALLMLAPPLLEAIAPQPREVVFIIDTSGSMSGVSVDQAKSALRQGLRFLDPEDRFNLIQFNDTSQSLFSESVPVYPAYLQEAADFIDALAANGGTVMAPALNMAMNLPEQDGLLRQIVFITDGSVGNEHELLLRIGENLRDSRLFTVSIGSAPNAWFMRKAAAIGRGSHTQIGKFADVEERMSSLWARIENPAVQNICVDWGMEAEFYPEIIPDLYAGEPLWVFARLPHEPREVTVCGELEGRYWEMSSRQLPGSGGSNLATLWARNKIEALEDSRIFGSDPAAIRQQSLGLALEYGLLTQYTSLVAVDKTPSRTDTSGLESEEVPGLLPAGSGAAFGFSQTATGWPARLILAFISLLVASGMLLYSPPSLRSGAGGARSPIAPSTQ